MSSSMTAPWKTSGDEPREDGQSELRTDAR